MGLKIVGDLKKSINTLISKAKDLSPVMRKIERDIMARQRIQAWNRSGLNSNTGKLKKSIKTWSGKTSAGVSVKTSGPDDWQQIAKAGQHMAGRKKGKQRRRRRKLRVKSYTRNGKKVRSYMRKSLSPWGDIKARPFMPTALTAGQKNKIKKLTREYLAKS